MRELSHQELFYTMQGRRHLEGWCSKTRQIGDAEKMLAMLKRAREEMPDEECPENIRIMA